MHLENKLLRKCCFLIAAPLEKLLQIILVRDVDGKTFWDALSDAISPRIAKPTTADETALNTFRNVFQDRPLKKGTFIFLTWLNPTKLLVSFFSFFLIFAELVIKIFRYLGKMVRTNTFCNFRFLSHQREFHLLRMLQSNLQM